LKVREKMELGCGDLQWYNSNELATRDVVHIFEYKPLNYLLVNGFGVAKKRPSAKEAVVGKVVLLAGCRSPLLEMNFGTSRSNLIR
jgi:hypothetical protein